VAKARKDSGKEGSGSKSPPVPAPPVPAPPELAPAAPPAATAPAPYVVLARKYRPRTFEDMIGQDALVRTLRNAFTTGRIAQGYMLTGVRGVGKTTTARILARALNYTTDTVDTPTVDMPTLGAHCAAILESRHPDVVEMDAASNTGVEDVREIIENARYKPTSARYKVFIVDEVHMLSKNAFNAFLKTLEEPPEHVKFVFATTEIRKVPVTVLSRCQRFDLRRVEVDVLMGHFQRILAAEGARADEEAVRLIARAAEGSVRDGLSILDQAIAMGSGEVKAVDVRAMLGLADRSRIFDLLELTLSGQPAAALDALATLHRDGAEPIQILADLAEAVHLATRTKIAGKDAAGDALSNEERARAVALAAQLSVPLLSRAWQMLLKGLEDAGKSGHPLAAAEMVLIRLAYTADLPSPDELMKVLGGAPAREGVAGLPPRLDARASGPVNAAPTGARMHAEDPPPPAWSDTDVIGPDDIPFVPPEDDDRAELEADIGPALTPPSNAPAAVHSFADVVDLAGRRRDAQLKVHLEDAVSLVRFDAGQGLIELHLLPAAPKELANALREKLNAWTGRKWMIAVVPTMGEATLGSIRREQQARDLEAIKRHPAVAKVLAAFPEAKIAEVRPTVGRTGETKAG
jgi:DNA polymerase-3 subunit gamma/tau